MRSVGVILFMACLVVGCVTPGVNSDADSIGSASGKYQLGELKVVFPESVPVVWAAALASVQDLGLVIIDRSKDAFDAKLAAENSTGRKVTIRLEDIRQTGTELRIRAGILGDETYSRVVLQQIESHLRRSKNRM